MALKINCAFSLFSCFILITTFKTTLSEYDPCCNFRMFEGVNATGKTLDYLNRPMAFQQAVAWMQQNQLSGYSWICIIKGIFIFYKKPDFVADAPSDVKIYSGKKKCDVASPLGLGSARHSSVHFWDPESVSYITMFSGMFYGGSVRISVKDHEAVAIKGQGIRSFLTVGPAKWAVKTESGRELCFSPFTNSEKVLVCLVPDASELLGDEVLDFTWKQVDQVASCSGEEILLKSCFDYETGEVQEPAVNPIGGKGNGNDSDTSLADDEGIGWIGGLGFGPVESPFNDQKSCDDYMEAAFVLRMRLTHNFKDLYQFVLPLNKTHAWRTELLDTTFDIFTETGILSSVPNFEMFVLEIREYFVYLLEKLVWSKGLGEPDRRTKDLKVLVHETKECLGMVKDSELVSMYSEAFQKAYNTIIQLELPKDAIVDAFQRSTGSDPLLEAVWLIFNLASFICHEGKGYQTNHWMDYHVKIKELYLEPMKEFWEQNDDFHKYYPIIFSGMKMNYNTLAIFASSIYKRFQFVDIITRPELTTETETTLAPEPESQPESPPDKKA